MAITKIFQQNATLLVIEDDDITRDLLASLAARMGFVKVFSALDGGEGLQMAAKNKPTVIVTDLQMEPVDGLMFLRAVRDHTGS
jgi:two-component system, chemotaxis family, chemotaxis protein CheY